MRPCLAVLPSLPPLQSFRRKNLGIHHAAKFTIDIDCLQGCTGTRSRCVLSAHKGKLVSLRLVFLSLPHSPQASSAKFETLCVHRYLPLYSHTIETFASLDARCLGRYSQLTECSKTLRLNPSFRFRELSLLYYKTDKDSVVFHPSHDPFLATCLPPS